MAAVVRGRAPPGARRTLTLLLDGSEEPFLNKPDNTDLDRFGNLLIQEDPGRNVHLGRIVAYNIHSGDRGVVAQFDPELFAPRTESSDDAPFTIDEESSGILDAREQLRRDQFLFDAQVHKAHPNPEYVEYGQLLKLRVSDWDAVYSQD